MVKKIPLILILLLGCVQVVLAWWRSLLAAGGNAEINDKDQAPDSLAKALNQKLINPAISINFTHAA